MTHAVRTRRASDLAVPLMVVGADGRLAGALDLAEATAIPLLGDDVVAQVLETRQPTDAVSIVGQRTFAVAAAPIATEDGEFLGAAVVTARLDDDFLASRVADRSSVDGGVGMALAAIGRA